MSEETIPGRKSFLSLFNICAGIIVVIGLYITYLRFTGGLGAVTNLSDYNPWGIWIGFDLLVGVALAAGGFVTSAAVYIFGMKRYHSAVRPAILTGFLGYAIVVLALHYDVGRPWRLPYPFIMQQGTTSVLFEVAACVALYLTVLFIEFSSAPLEWLGLKRARNIFHNAPIVSGCAFPDCPFQAASIVVFTFFTGIFLYHKYHCRALNGHFRKHPFLPLF